MFKTKNSALFLTLFLLIATIFVVTPAVGATSHVSGGVSRRDHSTLKRFVKKRAFLPIASNTPSDSGINLGGNPAIGAAPDPTDVVGLNSTSTTSSDATSTTDTTLSTTSQTQSTLVSSATDNSTSTTSSSSTTTSASTTSKTSTSTTSQTTQSSSSSSQSQAPSTTLSSEQTTITKTSTAPSNAEQTAQNASADAAPSGGLSPGGKTTLITVIIVVAASVGGVAVLWTVFRKWKLSRSSKFDQRLQPISWEPTVDDDIIPRRAGSDTASIHSAHTHSAAGYGATSNLSAGLEHDFTAGPAHLAPVGGYADLRRGPSPQPSMQETLNRGPSLTRPNYDASVPLHHQNNYGGY